MQKIIFESCILQYLVEREERERAIQQPRNLVFPPEATNHLMHVYDVVDIFFGGKIYSW